MTGAIDPDKARNLRDPDGNTFSDIAKANGLDPRFVGRDEQLLGQVGAFVELHVEQGRGLNSPEFTGRDEYAGQAGRGPAVAVGSSILGHGRWRFTVTGQGNHAGTTLMEDCADPMVAAAQIVLAVRKLAVSVPGARATVGRLEPVPGGTNVIASRVDLWLDVRHAEDTVVADLVERLHGQAQKIAAFEGCSAQLFEESYSGTVHFDAALARSLEHSVRRSVPAAPVLATGAGHDAGVLASVVPTGMLFVRNPSGISHSPEEFVEDEDAEAGVVALADALEDLL